MANPGKSDAGFLSASKEEKYAGEKILDRRPLKEKVQYMNGTWNPEESLDYQDFEDNRKLKEASDTENKEKPTAKRQNLSLADPSFKKKEKKSDSKKKDEKRSEKKANNKPNKIIKKKRSDKKKQGTTRGLLPRMIIAASDNSGKLKFLIKWRAVNKASLVPAKLANLKWPQMVIRYYERRILWQNPLVPVIRLQSCV